MPEDAFKVITGQNEEDAQKQNPGKNKILIQALDNSYSMSGSPIEALKLGAQMIGQKLLEPEERPFEQFHTFVYNNRANGFLAKDYPQYNSQIQNIRAGGGTNFMEVFKEIKRVLRENPDCEDLVVIFITDGQDGYYSPNGNRDAEYEQISAEIRSLEKVRSKFLSVGFSRGHDAAFMNRIANFGSEIGNFIFIDSYEEGWRDKLNESLLESLEIALDVAAKVKYQIKNVQVGHDEETKAEINYVVRQSAAQTERDAQPQ